MKQLLNELLEKNPALAYQFYFDLQTLLEDVDLIREYTKNLPHLPKGQFEPFNFFYELVKNIQIESFQLSLIEPILSEEKREIYDLTDDLTYTKPKGFDMNWGIYREVHNLKDLYMQLIELFYRMDEHKIRKLTEKSKFNGTKRPYFSDNPSQMISSVQIAPDFYIETNFSARKIQSLLLKLFHEFNIDAKHLRIMIGKDRKKAHGYIR